VIVKQEQEGRPRIAVQLDRAAGGFQPHGSEPLSKACFDDLCVGRVKLDLSAEADGELECCQHLCPVAEKDQSQVGRVSDSEASIFPASTSRQGFGSNAELSGRSQAKDNGLAPIEPGKCAPKEVWRRIGANSTSMPPPQGNRMSM
jgi:hypothetical protein